VAFAGELGKKGAQGGGDGWGIAGLLAKTEIGPEPLVVVGVMGLGDSCSDQAALDGGLQFWVQVLHGGASSPVGRPLMGAGL
jgi:hypothetical protein